MHRRFIYVLLVTLTVACRKHSTPVAESRSFYLGVTPWPADFTPDDITVAYNFINSHCDIVSHHFDEGIPYEETYTGSLIPQTLQNNISYRKHNTAAGKTILLSLNSPVNI